MYSLPSLVGSPPLFETTLLLISIINLLLPRLKRPLSNSHLPYLPLSSSADSITTSEVDDAEETTDPKDTMGKPSPVLILVVSGIFASTSYADALLRFTGVFQRQEVQFWGNVTFFSSVSYSPPS